MTRKTKRKLEKELESLKGGDPSDIEVSSSVTTITDDMTDESGNLIDESVPVSEPSERYTQGEQLDIESPVVDVCSLVPIDD